MRRILLVKTSSLGDVVHNFPVATDLRARFPQAEIDWAVEASLSELPALHPAIARVIPVELRRWRRNLLSQSTWREISALYTLLHGRAYDAVIDTQGLLKSAFITRLAPGMRCGLDWMSAREPLRPFYHRTFRVSWKLHAVERNRRLAAQSLSYTCDTPAQYGVSAPSQLEGAPDWTQPLATKTYAVLLHGTSARAKLWPEHQWVKLGDHLQHVGVMPVLLSGSHDEQLRSERIVKLLKHGIVAPRLALSEIAALLARADAVFGVDTGLTHLAAALGRPTIGIYCATDPNATGLYASERAVNIGDGTHAPPVAQVLAGWKRASS